MCSNTIVSKSTYKPQSWTVDSFGYRSDPHAVATTWLTNEARGESRRRDAAGPGLALGQGLPHARSARADACLRLLRQAPVEEFFRP
jgi:hypothetical protein